MRTGRGVRATSHPGLTKAPSTPRSQNRKSCLTDRHPPLGYSHIPSRSHRDPKFSDEGVTGIQPPRLRPMFTLGSLQHKYTTHTPSGLHLMDTWSRAYLRHTHSPHWAVGFGSRGLSARLWAGTLGAYEALTRSSSYQVLHSFVLYLEIPRPLGRFCDVAMGAFRAQTFCPRFWVVAHSTLELTSHSRSWCTCTL